MTIDALAEQDLPATAHIGIAMHRDNAPGYNQPRVYLVDEWH
ncbi:MAG TPA: hypothetical protein VLK82_28330 [Candidatus Tectomicrobia bacterium]|nr:hypothetical protein [Candidatus Tectomicrobia bacterium]